MTNIMVIPTTDWLRHPVPNRLNFIFDELAHKNNVYVMNFNYAKFKDNTPRETKCELIPAGTCETNIGFWYVASMQRHKNILQESIRKHDIDVIVSANIVPSFFARNLGIPVVYDYLDVMHEAASMYISNPVERMAATKLVFEIVKECLNDATKIITITPGLRNYLIDTVFYGSYHKFEDIHIIPNGVDTEIFKPDDQEQTDSAVYVGSLEGWVDLEIPISILSRMGIPLHVYGASLHTEYMTKTMHAARNAQQVIFHGRVPYRQLPQAINSHKIGLNPLVPSIHNRYSAGGKMFNYLACGVPMLSTPHCSPPFPPDNGAYWFYNNPVEFRTLVDEILSTPIERYKLHDMSLKYDWKRLAKEYYDVIKSVVR